MKKKLNTNKKRRLRNRKIMLEVIGILPGILLGILLDMLPGNMGAVTMVSAAENEIWSDAGAFYPAYGNDAVFHPLTETDGEICYGTRAALSQEDVRYLTIGWKMTFRDSAGQILQVLYFSLGGDYLVRRDEKSSQGYNYQLFSLSLSDIRGRLNSSAAQCLQAGSCRMQMDACMTVNESGRICGSIKDDGKTSGEVYTDYEGILSARDWSAKGKESLKNYFGKDVSGLFCRLTLHAGKGILKVQGSGSYLYGTKVNIQAVTMDHYRFSGWTGTISEDSEDFYEIMDQDMELTAEAVYIDQPPVISASDLYLSSEDRENGIITPENISSYFMAEDPEDGRIAFGRHEDNYMLLEIGDPEDAQIPVLVTAGDSAGHEVQKEVVIHIVDTAPLRKEKRDGRIRFISSSFYCSDSGTFVPEEEGGLMEGSVWICIKEYRSLLESVLEE